MKKPVLFLFLSLLACGVNPVEDKDAVTKVSITGTTPLAFYASTSLHSEVEGTGHFSPEVTWFIESGGGELSAMTGDTVTYTAPLVSTETPVTIRAVSQMDASKVGTLTLSITPPPPPAEFLAARFKGTELLSVQLGNDSGRFNPPGPITEASIQSNYWLKQVGATGLLLFGMGNVPSGVPIDVYPDGTLSILDKEGIHEGGHTWQHLFLIGMGAVPGHGTWDYKGNLTLIWSSRDTRIYNDHSWTPPTFIFNYVDHHFTAVRTPKEP